MVSSSTRLVAAAWVLFLLPTGAQAGLDAAGICTNNKAKAAGAKAERLLRAFGKNAERPHPTRLTAAISKAQSRLTRLFSRAESKGGCLTAGDESAIEAKVDSFVLDVENLRGRIGSDFPISSLGQSLRMQPDIGRAADGSFVVVWRDKSGLLEDGLDGSRTGVFGRRFDSTGVPLGPDFQVNTYTTGYQEYPAVGVAADGGFVVVWESSPLFPGGVGQDGDRHGVFGQRYDSTGAPLGGEFQVNTYTTQGQRFPDIGMTPTGDFVVVWRSRYQAVFGQRYNSTGAPVGSEFQISVQPTGSNQPDMGVGMHPTGAFVVVWRLGDIVGRRYDTSGAPLGGEFQINAATTASVIDPAVATGTDGRFVVSWTEFPESRDGDGAAVIAQRFDPAGTPVGPEILVNTFTTNDQESSRVGMAADGGFVVVWENWGATAGLDNSFIDVAGQRFDGTGTPIGGEIRVNTELEHQQYEPGLSVAPAGDFVAVWDPNYGPMRGQRFSK